MLSSSINDDAAATISTSVVASASTGASSSVGDDDVDISLTDAHPAKRSASKSNTSLNKKYKQKIQDDPFVS